MAEFRLDLAKDNGRSIGLIQSCNLQPHGPWRCRWVCCGAERLDQETPHPAGLQEHHFDWTIPSVSYRNIFANGLGVSSSLSDVLSDPSSMSVRASWGPASERLARVFMDTSGGRNDRTVGLAQRRGTLPRPKVTGRTKQGREAGREGRRT